jgi:hypothetical protein
MYLIFVSVFFFSQADPVSIYSNDCVGGSLYTVSDFSRVLLLQQQLLYWVFATYALHFEAQLQKCRLTSTAEPFAVLWMNK